MSLLADYWREREGRETIEDERGFATYTFINESLCYLIDLYVKPEFRRGGVASFFGDAVSQAARKAGRKKLLGSVDPATNGATDSVKVLLAYGMRVSHVGDDKLIYFIKDL